MTIKLEDICEIFIGVSRFKTDSQVFKSLEQIMYCYKVYRGLHDNSSILNAKNYDIENCFFEKQIDQKNYLLKGDILVKLVTPFKFILVDDNIDNIVVPSQYCILRPNSKVNSIWLWAYLNLFFNKDLNKLINKTLGLSSMKSSEFKTTVINLKRINNKQATLFYKNVILNNLLFRKKELLNQLTNYICGKET